MGTAFEMSFIASNLLVSLIALFLERFIGYPDFIYKMIRHPVVWMGGLIGLSDRLFNRQTHSEDTRKQAGFASLLALLFFTLLVAVSLTDFLRALHGGVLIEALLATSLLAQKSLTNHVQNVRDGLADGVVSGREAVSHIVGRDPTDLDESEVSKAAIESLAENAADGVVAPLFWMVLFGLPGAALYKAVNTADSMIGYKSERHHAFGWASARLDDVLNYPTSRLCGFLFVLCAYTSKRWQGQRAFRSMLEGAPHHLSPNAGWPEAAMAGALDIELGGVRFYDDRMVNLATMGNGRSALNRDDIDQALGLYKRSLTILAIALLGLLIIFIGFI